MNFSLYRIRDMFTLFILYLICFLFNLSIEYVQTIKLDTFLLETFFANIVDYHYAIVFFLTFIVILFHYQFLTRKKKEIFCRILTGDTRIKIYKRYLIHTFIILCINFTGTVLLSIFLDIYSTSYLFLFCVFSTYIFISTGQGYKI